MAINVLNSVYRRLYVPKPVRIEGYQSTANNIMNRN